jgi:hypothetical protein
VDRAGSSRVGRYEIVVALIVLFLLAYVAGTALRAPDALLVALFNVPVGLVPVGAWVAWRRTTGTHRRVWLLQALGATCWTVGTLIWYTAFELDGEVSPRNPGVWNAFFIAGYALAVAGMRVGLASAARLGHAVVDSVAIAAAIVAVGSALVARADAIGWTTRTLVVLARPAFGILMLVLVLSTLFGRWDTVRPSVLLLAVGHGFLVLGSVRGTLDFLAGDFGDDHWADVLWATGAACFLIATCRVLWRREEREQWRLAARPASSGLWLRLVLTILVFVGAAQVFRVAEGRPETVVSACAMALVGCALAFRAILELRDYRAELGVLEGRLRDAEIVGASIDDLRERNMDLRLRQIVLEQAAADEAGEQPEMLDGLMRAVTDLLSRTPEPPRPD